MVSRLQERLTNRETPAQIHLIGVAGSGMSGLALMLLEMGHIVSGSDKVTSDETERLKGLGLIFSSPHSAEAVATVDIVIYSSAIKENNPALAAALARGIPCLRRAECLAAILNNKNGVVVAGTHGKTTTSALCAHLLREGRQRPCHYVGAEIPILGANAHWNEESNYLIAEGDESDGTLIHYLPHYTIILNIEAEHLDYYKGLDEIKEVFHRLCNQTERKIIYCNVDQGAHSVCASRPNGISYGWADADYTATDVQELRGRTLFTINKQNAPLGPVELGIPGRHNILNSLAAAALALELGVSFEAVTRALGSFAGARRRFETKYFSKKIRIVDDYGHHPTEIQATLQTAQSLNPKRIVVVFQPHRYTRTQLLAEDFGRVLQMANLVFVTDIYPASEPPIEGVSGETIIEAARRHGPVEIYSVPDLATAHHTVGNVLKDGDLLITLGAGNVHEVGTRLARDLASVEEIERSTSAPLSIKLYESMKKHTTMKVGGCAQFWIEPKSYESFADVVNYCRERGIPVTLIGRGSNLIVRNGGIRGAVIHLNSGVFGETSVVHDKIIAGAGVKLKKLAALGLEHGLTGFEWMDGIPGNVGGSLRMNAGAMSRECLDNLVSVTCLNERGEIIEWERDELAGEYRNIPALKNNFVLSATFRGRKAPTEEIQALLEEGRQKRKLSQPVAPSAGCVFKNPEAIPAGKLVESLHLKGTRIGDAEISKVHGNFIVNMGDATAVDILALVDLVKREAEKQYGIHLDTEAQIIGDREYNF